MNDDTTKTLNNVVQIDEQELQGHLNQFVLKTVEDSLNQMLDAEADALVGADRYERTEGRKDYRSGRYSRKLHTKAGEVDLKMPKLRKQTFETAITIYEQIDEWRNRPIEGEFPYVNFDGVVLKRSWGGEVKNVSVLVAIGVGDDGYRRILGIVEGTKEDKAGWSGFLRHLKERGLAGVRLVISDACLGLKESIGDFYPDAEWQRCIVHFYRNVFSHVPRSRVKEVSRMLKAIDASEDLSSATSKAAEIEGKPRDMKLGNAADRVGQCVDETLTYYRFPAEHWVRIRTNNPLERIIR